MTKGLENIDLRNKIISYYTQLIINTYEFRFSSFPFVLDKKYLINDVDKRI